MELGRRIGDKRVVVQAEITCGSALVFLHRSEEALEMLETALPLAEAALAPDNPEEAMPPAEKANFTRHLADGILMFDILCTARGELDRSLEWAERGLALAKRIDNQDMIASRSGRVGLNLFYRGDWREARVHLERGTELVRSLGASVGSARLPGFLGMLSMAEGALEEAAQLTDQAIVTGERFRWPVPLHWAQVLLAQLDLARGRHRAALVRLEPLADIPDPHWVYATVLLTLLAQAHLEVGDHARAWKVTERAIHQAGAMNNRIEATGALRVKATMQGLQGCWCEAASTLEEALDMVRSMPYPYEEAKLSREYGMLHLRTGELELARERLSAALEIFRRLGATRDAESTERKLEDLDRA